MIYKMGGGVRKEKQVVGGEKGVCSGREGESGGGLLLLLEQREHEEARRTRLLAVSAWAPVRQAAAQRLSGATYQTLRDPSKMLHMLSV